MPTDFATIPGRPIARLWPWLVLLLATLPAVWHFVDFPDDLDGEYPKVTRPTFSPRPPSAYRLAEPGDTLDRVAMYGSAVVVVLAACGWLTSRRSAMWPAIMAAGAGTGWFAANPGPCYDGWHGLGWRAIFDASASWGLRIALSAAAIFLIAVIAISARRAWRDFWNSAKDRNAAALLVVACVLIACRAIDLPNIEPVGYWPRWSLVWGILAMNLAIVRLFPPWPKGSARWIGGLGAAGAIAALIAGGLHLTWLHRPLSRLRAVVPGQLYISAMPSYRGLEVEHERLKFKTIINLFDETTPQRSPRLPEELRFAKEHGIKYVGSPPASPDSDAFLDETLALVQDPNNWPVLVHCHGCMDRSPAWMGIYRFVVQGEPLDEIMKEIEGHRGVRPKASVTLLYNHVLPTRAPKHYAEDPTAPRLKAFAQGTAGPYDARERQVAGSNPERAGGVPRR